MIKQEEISNLSLIFEISKKFNVEITLCFRQNNKEAGCNGKNDNSNIF